MNLQDHSRVRTDGLRVIVEGRLICRTHLPQLCAARFDHFTDAEAAADLHELSARNDDFRSQRRARRSRPTSGSYEMVND